MRFFRPLRGYSTPATPQINDFRQLARYPRAQRPYPWTGYLGSPSRLAGVQGPARRLGCGVSRGPEPACRAPGSKARPVGSEAGEERRAVADKAQWLCAVAGLLVAGVSLKVAGWRLPAGMSWAGMVWVLGCNGPGEGWWGWDGGVLRLVVCGWWFAVGGWRGDRGAWPGPEAGGWRAGLGGWRGGGGRAGGKGVSGIV